MDHFLGRNDEQMQCRGILHIVEAGDTLYRIGKKYGVPVSRIMYANPYVNVYNLQIGDEICVPVMTPRMLMGENDMPGSRMPAREDNMPGSRMPAREDNMPGSVMPAREDDMLGSRMPARENNMPGSRMPMNENPMMDSTMPTHENAVMDSRMPARENPMDDSRMPARRDCMEESGVPGQKCIQRRAVPETDYSRNGMYGTVRGNRMGFPLAPLKEVIVDVDHESENRTYMGNRMTSAEESGRSGMREAAPKPEEDQSMRNQPDTDHTQIRTGNDSSGCQQNPAESMCSGEDQTGGMRSFTENREQINNPGREYTPGAEGCTEKENYPGRKNSKALPWDDTGVSKKMMHEYLQEAPQETSKGL